MNHAGGRCLCGAVTFNTEGEPLFIAHCHCESCRRQTGSVPATFVGFRSEQVSYPAKPPVEFESSAGIFRAFCARCGSALHYRPAADGETHMYLGAFDTPETFIATRHVFFDERVAPYETYDNLPRYDQRFAEPVAWGPRPPRELLFLCRDDAGLSILAEAIANRTTPGGVRAHSAGLRPAAALPEDVRQLLVARRFNTDAFIPKGMCELLEDSDLARMLERIVSFDEAIQTHDLPPAISGVPIEYWSLPESPSETTPPESTYQILEQRIGDLFRRAL